MIDAGLDAESVRLMKLVVREHTEAICRAALAANP
jgi:aryl carrier-like protein